MPSDLYEVLQLSIRVRIERRNNLVEWRGDDKWWFGDADAND
ncbi:MAG: hypothetical protein ACKVKH_10875 [Verrucomicrobiales bacterium]